MDVEDKIRHRAAVEDIKKEKLRVLQESEQKRLRILEERERERENKRRMKNSSCDRTNT